MTEQHSNETDQEFYNRVDKEAEDFHNKVEMHLKGKTDKKLSLRGYVRQNMQAFRRFYSIEACISDNDVVRMAVEAYEEIL